VPRYRFSVEQRDRLHRCDLIDAQIEELEAILPVCRAMTTDDARLQDVRAELEDAAKAIGRAQRSISRLFKGDKSSLALFEALNRVQAASYDAAAGRYGEIREFDGALDAMSSLAAVVAQALDGLGNEERRTNIADPRSIENIYDALLRGWAKRSREPSKIFNIRASRGPKSKFREVAGICYEAIERDIDPERAIRAYMGERTKRHKLRK